MKNARNASADGGGVVGFTEPSNLKVGKRRESTKRKVVRNLLLVRGVSERYRP